MSVRSGGEWSFNIYLQQHVHECLLFICLMAFWGIPRRPWLVKPPVPLQDMGLTVLSWVMSSDSPDPTTAKSHWHWLKGGNCWEPKATVWQSRHGLEAFRQDGNLQVYHASTKVGRNAKCLPFTKKPLLKRSLYLVKDTASKSAGWKTQKGCN
jgi:hypothetical protein